MDYRKYLEKQALFDAYQERNGLNKETLHRLIDALPRDLNLRHLEDEKITQALDNTSLIGVARHAASFHQSHDGGIQIIAYLAPNAEMRKSMTGIIECRMTLPLMPTQEAMALLDRMEASLPADLVYPYKEGRDLIKAGKQHSNAPSKRSKGKRLIHPPIWRQHHWHFTGESSLSEGVAEAKTHGEVIESEQTFVNGIEYNEQIDYRLDHGYWRIYVTLPHLPTFKIRIPCPPLRQLHDIAAEDYQILQIIEHLEATIGEAETQKHLAYIAEQMPPHARDHVKCSVEAGEDPLDKISSAFHAFIDQKHRIAQQMRLKRERKEQFQRMVASRPYHHFMYRAKSPRRIRCYIAPTNAGKSWKARHDLLETVAYSPGHQHAALFPLRMLALENQLWFHEHDTPASLVTGEERDLDPAADILCQTVETLDLSEHYHTIMVDEAQLTFSADRGPAYLRALVAADCHTLIMTASPESREQLTALFASMGETVEFIDMERLCPLDPLNEEMRFRDVESGDLVVVFSTKILHDIAERLRQQGFSVGTLYGSMPPTARRHMMASYQAGDIDVMVATDAIGMGCNCPVRRVLFAQTHKYDGKSLRELTTSEFKQIAGRAGRYGLAERGYFGVLDTGMFEVHYPGEVAAEVMSDPEQAPMKALYALPDREVFLESDFTLKDTLEYWIAAIKQSSDEVRYRFHGESISELAHKSVFLDRLIAQEALDHELATRLLFVAFSYDQLGLRFQEWVKLIINDQPIRYLEELDLKRQPREGLEGIAKTLAMLAQFQRIVPDLCPDEASIMAAHETVGEMIFADLTQRYTQKRLSEVEEATADIA